jgi:anti-anti-sigma regulatory factor
MPIALDKRETESMIRVEGEVGIASAAELKAILLQALSLGKKVSVDLEQATDLDVTTLQLLWAAERAFRAAGTEFVLDRPLPQPVAATLSEAGFETFPLPQLAKQATG